MIGDQIVLRNATTYIIEFPDLGEQVDSGEIINVTYIGKTRRATSTTLINAIIDGSLLMIRDIEPETYWTPSEALLLLALGINKTMMQIEKVTNTLHNFNALNSPDETNDETEGYSRGSIWIATTISGFRAWVCADAGVGQALWGELTQPPIHPGVVENRFYGPAVTEPLVSDSNVSNALVAVPLAYPTGISWNRIGVEVTAAAAGGSARLGIYSNDNARPGKLLLDAGFVTIDTVGKKEIVINFQNPADWFWLVVVTSQSCSFLSATGDLDGALLGLTDPSASTGTIGGSVGAMPYGVLPQEFPTITEDAQRPPYIWLRRV